MTPAILSPHFTLAELTHTSKALPNQPSVVELARLRTLCLHHLEAIRAQFGPLRVTSGYRSPAVNAATPGAAQRSAHRYGCAADFVPWHPVPDLAAWVREVTLWVRRSGLDFDQVIDEQNAAGGRWVHYGIRPPWLETESRRMAMVQRRGKYEVL